ncbi:MAG TPA: hypothetical protein PKZ54_09745, partial [Syntrophorhabdaceae bacterium]|nr:hypothetical protein [Syntrophorhabdaceae bacterium]
LIYDTAAVQIPKKRELKVHLSSLIILIYDTAAVQIPKKRELKVHVPVLNTSINNSCSPNP